MTESRNQRNHGGIGPSGSHVARNLKRLRTLRGMTTEALAKELTARGIPIQASAITRIERRQRRVTVDELVAFSVVLDANPNALLLPVEIDRGQPVAITGHGNVPAALAWQWADGEEPLPGRSAEEDQEGTGFEDTVRPWWLRRPIFLPPALKWAEENVNRLRRIGDRARARSMGEELLNEEGDHGPGVD